MVDETIYIYEIADADDDLKKMKSGDAVTFLEVFLLGQRLARQS